MRPNPIFTAYEPLDSLTQARSVARRWKLKSCTTIQRRLRGRILWGVKTWFFSAEVLVMSSPTAIARTGSESWTARTVLGVFFWTGEPYDLRCASWGFPKFFRELGTNQHCHHSWDRWHCKNQNREMWNDLTIFFVAGVFRKGSPVDQEEVFGYFGDFLGRAEIGWDLV